LFQPGIKLTFSYPLYRYEDGVTNFKKMPGKPPVMFFLNSEGSTIEQVAKDMSRCHAEQLVSHTSSETQNVIKT
jgi:hypothetical protein